MLQLFDTNYHFYSDLSLVVEAIFHDESHTFPDFSRDLVISLIAVQSGLTQYSNPCFSQNSIT